MSRILCTLQNSTYLAGLWRKSKAKNKGYEWLPCPPSGSGLAVFFEELEWALEMFTENSSWFSALCPWAWRLDGGVSYVNADLGSETDLAKWARKSGSFKNWNNWVFIAQSAVCWCSWFAYVVPLCIWGTWVAAQVSVGILLGQEAFLELVSSSGMEPFQTDLLW